MKKVLRKISILDELAKEMQVISKHQQRTFIGGGTYGDGNNNSSYYTQSQFFNWEGDWTGGFVEGLGYVSADIVITGAPSGYYNPTPYPGQEALFQSAYDIAFANAASGETWNAIRTIGYGILSAIVMNTYGEFNGNDPGMQAINIGVWQGFIDGRKAYGATTENGN